MLHLKFTLSSIAKTMSVRRKSMTNDEHEHQAYGRRKSRQVDLILIQTVAMSTWLTFSHGCQHDCTVRPLFDFVPAAATGMPQLSRRVVAILANGPRMDGHCENHILKMVSCIAARNLARGQSSRRSDHRMKHQQ